MTTAILWLLYLGVAACIAGAARFFRRPVAAPVFAVLVAIPIVILAPGFFGARTLFPVDQALSLPPWSSLAREAPHNPNLNDVATQMAPWAKAARMAYKEGSLPWLDRWNGCGTPLAANGQSAPFSPFTILMLALPLARAFTLLAAMKLLLALSGSWLWLREIKLSRTASLLGAVSFSLSLAMTAWLLFPHTAVIALWPWAFFAAELLREEPQRHRAFALLVCVLTTWALAGHPENAALGAGFLVIWTIVRRLFGDRAEGSRILASTGVAGATALGLAAFLLVPEVLAIAASNRVAMTTRPFWAGILSIRPHGPPWPGGLLTAFFPRAFGDAIRSPMIQGAAGAFPEMALAYPGLIAWAFVLLIFRPGAPRRKEELALLAPFVFGLGAATGTWPFAEIAGVIPVIRIMFPLRFFSWTMAAGSAIAAFEIDRLAEDLRRGWSALAWLFGSFGALALLGVTAFSWLKPRYAAAGEIDAQKTALLLALATLGAAAAVTAVTARRRRLFVAVGLPLLILVAGGELYRQGTRLYRFGDPASLFPPTPLARFLRDQPPPFRAVGEGAAIFPNTNVFAGVEEIRTHDPIERREYVDFLDRTAGYDSAEYFKFVKNFDAPSLDLLNVRYLVVAPGGPAPGSKWHLAYEGRDGALYENRRALPRVFAPRTVRLAAAGAPDPVSIRDFSEVAVVEAPPIAGLPMETNGTLGVADFRESTNRISFRARAAGRVVAVASYVQDGGWSARDETGRNLRTMRADGPFLAFDVPSGVHLVTLTYRPPGLAQGCALTIVTFLLLAAISVQRFVRNASAGLTRSRATEPMAGRGAAR
jgi:hypothetical protein